MTSTIKYDYDLDIDPLTYRWTDEYLTIEGIIGKDDISPKKVRISLPRKSLENVIHLINNKEKEK